MGSIAYELVIIGATMLTGLVAAYLAFRAGLWIGTSQPWSLVSWECYNGNHKHCGGQGCGCRCHVRTA